MKLLIFTTSLGNIPVINLIPFSFICVDKLVITSSSNPLRIFSPRIHTVTSTPKPLKIEANSTAI